MQGLRYPGANEPVSPENFSPSSSSSSSSPFTRLLYPPTTPLPDIPTTSMEEINRED
jgi:hypothetical protein